MKKAYKILDHAKAMQKKDYDIVFLVVGKEGRGKSMFMLACMDYLKGIIDNVAMNGDEFVKILSRCEYEDPVSLDEAGEVLFSRDAMTKRTKELTKIYTQIRGKRLITFLVLPNANYIDRYFREHRVDGMFYIYKRGRYQFYDKKFLSNNLPKNGYIPLNLYKTDSFPMYKGYLKKAYDEKKQNLINGLAKEKEKVEIDKKSIWKYLRGKGMTLQGIADLEGCSQPNVYNTLKRNNLLT